MELGPTKFNVGVFFGITLSLLLIPSPPAKATMYRCFDTTGTTVLTDTPAQLQDCTVLDPKKPSGQISTPTPRKAKRISRSRHRRPVSAPQRVAPPPQEELFEETQEDDAPTSPIKPITVPVTKIGGSLVVQVLLNGSVDAHLIVDTGATMTVLSYDLGIELGILSGSDVSLNTVNTAGGSVQVSMTHVETLQVGSAKVSHVAVAIHDLPDGISGVSGLLGMSFLRNFEITLDADRGFLRLLPKTKK